LPWWTLLPRKLLLAASPIIAVVVVVMVLGFTARRIWRYPLFLIGGTILTGLGVGVLVVGAGLAGRRAGGSAWAELLKEAGVREARLHDARHYLAFYLP
jgi:F0F1-type ATP synthase assembly protein I